MYISNRLLAKQTFCLITIFAIATVLFGCGSTSKPTPSPRYYNSLSGNVFADEKDTICDTENKKRNIVATTYDGIGPCYDTISVSLFASAASPATTKTAADLHPEGQQAFIERLSKDENVYSALATPFTRTFSNETGKDDSALVQKRKLIFTIATTRMAPADRITEAHLIAKAPTGWEFVSWSGFDTVRSDIKRSTVTDGLTNRLKASAGVAEKVFQELAGVNFEAERTRNYLAVSDLQFDVVKFLPILTKQQAEFILSAPFPHVNVSGSYSVDVTLKYNGTHRAMNIELGGKPTDKKIRPIQTAFIPEYAEDVISYELPYTVRRVLEGQSTIEEDDDKAIYMYVDGSKVGVNNKVPGAAKIGSQISQGEDSLGLKANRTKVSAITINSEVLLIEFPPNVLGIPTCLINLNGAPLNELLTWVKKDPSRLEMKDKDGKLSHRFTKLNGRKLTANEIRNAVITRYDITDFMKRYQHTCPVAFTN
ncbi:hypothetical protein [Rheinheimera aquimaris]|uniref:hypothetical protein n=1 Tax=Rheinheimera aquimaris TaxID=412437 RepID=UPI001064D840|nr:hypothetical protein [Rheinheimera aquimaris]